MRNLEGWLAFIIVLFFILGISFLCMLIVGLMLPLLLRLLMLIFLIYVAVQIYKVVSRG